MFRRSTSAMISAALAGCLAAAGCTPVALPPPAIPDHVIAHPPPPIGPPPQGMGQVTIDTANEEPTIVEEISGRVDATVDATGNSVAGNTYATVCRSTPCVANLPFGVHDLELTSRLDPRHVGAGSITIGPQPTSYRYALGHSMAGAGGFLLGMVAVGLGVSVATSGAVLVGIGQSLDGGGSATKVGAGLLIGGLALSAVGVVLVATHRPEYQDGVGAQWAPTAP